MKQEKYKSNQKTLFINFNNGKIRLGLKIK